MTGKMRKLPGKGGPEIASCRNDKALNNQGFVVSNMAEAMGFELMDLLQSTVFKTAIQSLQNRRVQRFIIPLLLFFDTLTDREL
ncbi:hypothetical protein QS468_55535 [Bacillus subtilis]|nr:hypothetical protein [Pseudomonas sp. A29(2023)]MDL5602014.1 hypothetical protein [Bacillus subtilis]